VKQALASVIRDLHTRRGRERRGRTLVEGVRLVEDVRAAGVPIRGVAVAPALEATPRGAALKRDLVADGIELLAVPDDELHQLAATEQPQGIVAVVDLPAWTAADLRPAAERPLLVLDALQDPGNVGTILRTALALGASGAVLLDGTVELANPKVLRASMGAAFRLPAVSMTADDFLAWSRSTGLACWVADMHGDPAHAVPRDPRPVALVVGNEGAGVRPALAGAAARTVCIPIAAGAESLNVGVAAAILLYELRRGR
jgi:TrmH family RNA methyltransferase